MEATVKNALTTEQIEKIVEVCTIQFEDNNLHGLENECAFYAEEELGWGYFRLDMVYGCKKIIGNYY